MSRISLLFLPVCIFFSANAQHDFIQRSTNLIVQKQYAQAFALIDSVIKVDSRNTDAWMMKGNAILNSVLDTAESMQFINESDESIFTNNIVSKPVLLPLNTALLVEKCWRKALELDGSRTDVRKGLCTVYSLSLMKDSLKTELSRLRKMLPDNDEEAFKMCEYARKLKERNRFDDAMEIYSFVAGLFPSTSGVRCDMASEYFYEGKINEALLWLDSTYRFTSVDETSFLNGAFIFSQLGYFENAQSVINAYSRIYKRRLDDFYFGLTLFADSSDKCTQVLQAFCSNIDTNSYYDEYLLAQKLIVNHSTFSIETYRSLTTQSGIPDYYKVLIHVRALKQFRSRCEPYFMYGVYSALIKNYSASVQFLEDVGQCKLQADQTEYWKLVYGFVLLKTGQPAEAKKFFTQLFSSSNNFYKHAAKYFAGKILLAEQNREAAVLVFTELKNVETSRTKFCDLAAAQLSELSVKKN